MKLYNSRNEVEEKYKWDLSEYFKDEEEFDSCFKIIDNKINNISKYIGCTKNSNKLYEYLEESIFIDINVMDLYAYAILINDQELGISKSIERLNKTISLYTKNNSANSFFAPELLKLNKLEYDNLFKNEKLIKYKSYLDKIYRNVAHILSDNEEKIVNELTSSVDHFSEISSTLLSSEHKYGYVTIDKKEIEIANNNYSSLMKNSDIKIRKEIYKKFNKVLNQYSSTCASILNSYVSMNETIAKIHKFNSSWEEKLFSYNLTDKVYKLLVKSAEENLEPLHKYYRLRKKVLNLKKLHSYDLYVKLSDNDSEYSIEDAWDIIINSLKVLGNDYITKLKKVRDNRNIDYCQYKGKCFGGYNISTLDKFSRILMSYNYDLDSISTIAHESGHHVNHQYIYENNDSIYRENTVIVAEVASLTNEILLSNYLLKNSDNVNEKLAGLENIIDIFISNFYGAIREGKLEQNMHNWVLNGNTITNDYMNNEASKSLKKYYGKEVITDNYSNLSWIRRSHYYTYYYLYSYAISVSTAVNCAKKIIDGDSKFISKYKKFLSLGSDVWPIDAYKILGIDLENENVYIDAINYFNSLVDTYNKLVTEER